MNIFSRTERNQSSTSTLTDIEFGDIRLIAVKNARTLRLFVHPFQGVIVKYPRGISPKKITCFVEDKRSWIRQALERARITEKQSREHFSTLDSPSPAAIRKSLNLRLDELARAHGFNYNKISIRNQKSRWGSCSARNNISLNRKLYFLPHHLRDYVLVHELAHTREKNHSPAFWGILFDILGKIETGKMRRELKSFDYLFYPPTKSST